MSLIGREWRSRISALLGHPALRLVALASLVLLLAVRIVDAGLGADPTHALYALGHLDAALSAGLWAIVVTAIAVLGAEDRAHRLEALDGSRRGSIPAFVASRVLAVLALLLVSAAGLGVAVAGLSGGQHLGEQSLHVLVLCLDRFPFAVVGLLLCTVAPWVIAVAGAIAVHAAGNEATYDRVAAADGLAPDSLPLHAEQTVRFLFPHPLVDPFFRRLVENASIVINQFPVRQSGGIWGGDLTAVSPPSEILSYLVYLAALVLLYVVAVWRVAARNSRRTHLRPLPVA